jgi:hypothetical protein
MSQEAYAALARPVGGRMGAGPLWLSALSQASVIQRASGFSRSIVTLLLERAAGLSPEELRRLAADRYQQPRTGILSTLTSG